MNLQYRMILDYTARVERLHLGKHPTELTVDVANYIQHHMSELITAEKSQKSCSSAAHISPENSRKRRAKA